LNLLRGFTQSKSGVIAVGSGVRLMSGVTLRQPPGSGVTERNSFLTCMLSQGEGSGDELQMPGSMLLICLIRCS
jgi:hypothetical protein